jgi:hypothetical protein
MRKLPLLKSFASILFALSMIVLFFAVPFIILWLFMPERVPFKLDGEPMTTVTAELVILLISLVIGLGFFAYALYLFKTNLGLFEKKKIFDATVIKNFAQMGKAILLGYLFCAVPVTLYKILAKNATEIDFEFIIDSLFIAGLGLFFIVLSEVFQMAKNIKEENDLTV